MGERTHDRDREPRVDDREPRVDDREPQVDDREPQVDGKEMPSGAAFPSRTDRHMALTRALRREDSLTTEQLHGLGLTRHDISGLIRHGDLRRLFHGVYVDGRTRITPWIHLKAALLAAGPTAFLSHRTAAAARKLRNINLREIHVSVVADHTPRISGLRLHRTVEPARGEVSSVGGLRASTVPRILMELAPAARNEELEELVTAAERRSALDPNLMAAVLDRHAGRRGISKLRAVIDAHISTPGGNSDLEADVWAWHATQPDLPPPDEVNVRIGPFEFDGLWIKERLVLEIDSRTYHQALADMEKDRIKDAYVQKLGLRILRITDFRFAHDKPGIRADFLAFLRPRKAA